MKVLRVEIINCLDKSVRATLQTFHDNLIKMVLMKKTKHQNNTEFLTIHIYGKTSKLNNYGDDRLKATGSVDIAK